MPTERFRMARVHLGHNGPPLLHNVIPELTLNRVNIENDLFFLNKKFKLTAIIKEINASLFHTYGAQGSIFKHAKRNTYLISFKTIEIAYS